MELLNNIDRKLKVGPDCFFMNISSVLELKHNLFLSLAYTNFHFLFNKECFTMFKDPKPAVEYISKDNELVITEGIDSIYYDDFKAIMLNYTKEIYDFEVKTVSNSEIDVSLEDIKKNYLDKGIPVLFTLDHYYVYEDYRKVTNDILHFHSPGHMAVLYDIDFENKEAFLVDRFYSFVGTVQLGNLKKAIEFSHNYFEILNYETLEIPEEEGFIKYFVENISKIDEMDITVDGRVYEKNSVALENLVKNFGEVIEELYRQKGKYAPQFLSKLLTPMILQRVSFNNLIQYGKKKFENPFYQRLASLTEQSSKLWMRIDAYNDKCYLSGKTILESIDLYNTLLAEILKVDGEVYSILDEFVEEYK